MLWQRGKPSIYLHLFNVKHMIFVKVILLSIDREQSVIKIVAEINEGYQRLLSHYQARNQSNPKNCGIMLM